MLSLMSRLRFNPPVRRSGWSVALTNNNAQTSLNCALKCGLRELIKYLGEEMESLEVTADTSGESRSQLTGLPPPPCGVPAEHS